MSSSDSLLALFPEVLLPSLPPPAQHFPGHPWPCPLVVPAAWATHLLSSSDMRQVFFRACKSAVYNGVALHRGSLRSFMAVAGMGKPIAGTNS